MFREGSPFMEFLCCVGLLVGAGAALFALALAGADNSQVAAFFEHAAETLLGAVIALAYAARGGGAQAHMTPGGDVELKTTTRGSE